jgi:hypothetical protein
MGYPGLADLLPAKRTPRPIDFPDRLRALRAAHLNVGEQPGLFRRRPGIFIWMPAIDCRRKRESLTETEELTINPLLIFLFILLLLKLLLVSDLWLR